MREFKFSQKSEQKTAKDVKGQKGNGRVEGKSSCAHWTARREVKKKNCKKEKKNFSSGCVKVVWCFLSHGREVTKRSQTIDSREVQLLLAQMKHTLHKMRSDTSFVFNKNRFFVYN